MNRLLACVVFGALTGSVAGCSSSVQSQANADELCQITTTVLGSLVDGLAHDEDLSSLISILDHSGLGNKACKTVVTALQGSPTTEVRFRLETSTGAVIRTASKKELTVVPPAPQTSVQRVIDCWAWHSSLLEKWCDEGTINPPQR